MKDLLRRLAHIKNLAILMNESHEKRIRARTYRALIDELDIIIERLIKEIENET